MKIDDAYLESARRVGDPPLDRLVMSFADRHGRAKVAALMGQLFERETLPADHPLVDEYLALYLSQYESPPELVLRGQALFELYGVETLLILGCYALPLAYAAGSGAQVVHRARRMSNDGLRRLCETAQMVINVMQPGELAADGVGTRAIRKVRLMHALVRFIISTDSDWSDEHGIAINQEDLAGTLLTFSLVPIHGLERIGARIDPVDAQAFFITWAYIGRSLGIANELIPGCHADAVELARRIGRRQLRSTPEGTILTEQLSQVVDGMFPVRGYGRSLMRFFLEDTIFGDSVAVPELLGMRPCNWTMSLVRARAMHKQHVLKWLPLVPGAVLRRRFLARYFAQALVSRRQPAGRVPFELPPRFRRRWRVS